MKPTAPKTAPNSTLDALRDGGKPAMARALAQIERSPDVAATTLLLDEAHAAARGHVIGITGPPGVGKSTLINALIARWRKTGKTIGVIAVDPSSRRSGGALLGDRARMTTDPDDQGVYVRSIASRGRLGGLADLAFPAIVLMRAVFDVVIVESVGVGQSEAEITAATDTVLLCVQPGSGDSLQFMKAGIMEIPDIAVVTKSDFGASANRARADLEGALSLNVHDDWRVKVVAVSANTGAGFDELDQALDEHASWLHDDSRLEQRRAAQSRAWVQDAVLREYGRTGLGLIGSGELDGPALAPFSALSGFLNSLRVSRT